MILLILAQLHLYSDKPITVDASPLCQGLDQKMAYVLPENTMCVSHEVIHKQLIFKGDFEVKK